MKLILSSECGQVRMLKTVPPGAPPPCERKSNGRIRRDPGRGLRLRGGQNVPPSGMISHSREENA